MGLLGNLAGSAISAALPFWVKPLLLFLAIAAWSGTCYVKGMQHVQKRWDHEQAVNQLTQAVEFKRVETIVDRVVYQIVPQIRVVEKQGREIIKKVPVYVPQEAADRCVINNGFVWLLEEARSGVQIPYDPARIVDAAPGIGLADVGKIVSGNYNKFRRMRLQCQGLLEIVKSLPQRKN